MSIIASAILLSLLTAPSPPPVRLRVDLSFEGLRMWPPYETAVMNEVTHIWSAYGVEIRRARQAPQGAAAQDGVIRLSVVLADAHDAHAPGDVLGSIAFFADAPTPRIVMYPNTIGALVSGTNIVGRSLWEYPVHYRENLLGRAFGRALAHEIGHFLLRSPHHAPAGLMQARHSVNELVAPESRHFDLSEEEVRRLPAASAPARELASH